MSLQPLTTTTKTSIISDADATNKTTLPLLPLPSRDHQEYQMWPGGPVFAKKQRVGLTTIYLLSLSQSTYLLIYLLTYLPL